MSWLKPSSGQQYSWELFKQPERFTEIYFTTPTTLPKKYTPGETHTLAFTVHNLENSSIRYTYEIFQQNETGSLSLPLKKGDFSLAHTIVHHESVPITYADLGEHSRIIVRLPNQHQTLQYWVEKRS